MNRILIITKYTLAQMLLVIWAISSCTKMQPATRKIESKSTVTLLSCDSLLKLYATKPKIELWLNENPEILSNKETAFDILGDSLAKALGYTVETWKNGDKQDTIFMIGEGEKIEVRIIPNPLLTLYCKEKPVYGMEKREFWLKCGNTNFRKLGAVNSENSILKNNGLVFPVPETHDEGIKCKGSHRLFFKIIARNIFYRDETGKKIILLPAFEWQAEIL